MAPSAAGQAGGAGGGSLDIETRHLMSFAAKSAETFVSAYYAAADGPGRNQLLPTLYLPDSTIVWNGTPIAGNQEFAGMLQQMPVAKHEVQSFDCQPIGGGLNPATNFFEVPSLMLTIQGVVTHHTPDSITAQPASNAPKSAAASAKGKGRAGGANSSSSGGGAINFIDAPIDSLPHAFSQNFLLVNLMQADGGVNCQGTETTQQVPPASAVVGDNKKSTVAGGSEGSAVTLQPLVGKFFVQAENFRFVG